MACAREFLRVEDCCEVDERAGHGRDRDSSKVGRLTFVDRACAADLEPRDAPV
jgi:hypothetical protein